MRNGLWGSWRIAARLDMSTPRATGITAIDVKVARASSSCANCSGCCDASTNTECLSYSQKGVQVLTGRIKVKFGSFQSWCACGGALT